MKTNYRIRIICSFKYAAGLTKKLVPSLFSLLMLLVITLAFMFPEFEQQNGVPSLSVAVKYGTSAIFFYYGASLNTNDIIKDLANWRTHVLVQTSTYILFPLIGMLLYSLAKILLTPPLELGFIFLASLPTTISSCVSLTSIARGNVSAAIFNTTLSCLLGFFFTPFIVGLIALSEAIDFQIMDSIAHASLILLAPFVAGQLLRKFIKPFVQRYCSLAHITERSIILLVVFDSFSTTVNEGLWTTFRLNELITACLMIIFVMVIVFTFALLSARTLGISLEDKIAVVFCGTSKSLAIGVPTSHILFSTVQGSGLLILPLLLYHQAHIIACSIMANYYIIKAK